jgi:site-specific DNA recombinase
VLLVDDTSRISRNVGETARFYEQLAFQGIRVMALSQGIDSQSEQADVLLSVHGLVDSLYIKELAKKTHRGLEGRALLGQCTGGRCFGYDNVAEAGIICQRVNPGEAAIVRRIFEMAAEGGSLKIIAKKLNDDRVASPRPRAGKQYATWCPTAIRAMLRRELYAGRVIWNRSRFVKGPGSNKRLRRERPKNEWRIVERPELRIVDDALWTRVQRRIERIAEQFKGKRPGLYNRAASSPYLLTGFLKCSSCGASLAIVTGRRKGGHGKYGCPQNFYRGACPNDLKEGVEVVEERLLAGLQRSVLQPDAINYALQEFERQLSASLVDLSTGVARMRERRDAIQRELDRLIAAVASVGHSPALVKAINEREQELSEIARRVLNHSRIRFRRVSPGPGCSCRNGWGIFANCSIPTFRGPRKSWRSTLQGLRWSRRRRARKATMSPLASGTCWVDSTTLMKSAFGWLRGKGLNLRPLGYEFARNPAIAGRNWMMRRMLIAQRFAQPEADDANDILYAFEASRDYDPAPRLETITASVLAVNSAAAERNPPELGIMEREIHRLKHGRYILIPTSPETRDYGFREAVERPSDRTSAPLSVHH